MFKTSCSLKRKSSLSTEIYEVAKITITDKDKKEIGPKLGLVGDDFVRKLCAPPFYNGTIDHSLPAYERRVSENRAVTFFCKVLIDRRYEEILAARNIADTLKLRRQKVILKAKIWAGILVEVQRCTKPLFIKTGEIAITVRPYIKNWTEYDLILNQSWPSEVSPKTFGCEIAWTTLSKIGS